MKYMVSKNHNNLRYKGKKYEGGQALPDDFPDELAKSHSSVIIAVVEKEEEKEEVSTKKLKKGK